MDDVKSAPSNRLSISTDATDAVESVFFALSADVRSRRIARLFSVMSFFVFFLNSSAK
jgi:hypothetical protein